MLLDTRVDIGESADRARNRAGGDLLAGGNEALLGAQKFGIGKGKLEAERDGLGVDAVAPADGQRVLVLESPAFELREKLIEIGQEDIGGAHELHIEAGIEHVGRGHALVKVARVGPDNLAEMREEGD